MPRLPFLSAEIDRLSPAAPDADRTISIPSNPRHNALTLSSTQLGLWFLNRLTPDAAAYNRVASIKIEGPLDAESLRETIVKLQDRHESLRTRFHQVDR